MLFTSSLIRSIWDVQGLASDLKDQQWEFTEKNRIDRQIFLASWDFVKNLVQNEVSDDEWREAFESGFEGEIVEDFLEVLVEEIGKEIDGNFYWVVEQNDIFIGQYEEGTEEELRKFLNKNLRV